MPLPHGYSEALHFEHDRFAGEATWRFFADHACEHRVLPDGRCDIILRFHSDGIQPLGAIVPLITGAATRFHIVSVAAETGYVGVRLRPGMAQGVIGLVPRTITNQGIAGDAALKIVPDLKQLCDPAPSIDALMKRLTSFIVQRSAHVMVDAMTTRLIDTIHTSGGRLPISGIATLHGVDVRTVHRRIVRAAGLTPKQLAMVIQFQRALRLRFREGLDAAATAFEAGYADQAHMSRIFRQMGGISTARLPDLVLAGLPI